MLSDAAPHPLRATFQFIRMPSWHGSKHDGSISFLTSHRMMRDIGHSIRCGTAKKTPT
jgi:hypothetical protein